MDYFRKIDRKCLVCGNTFKIKPSQLDWKGGGKYCSKKCFYNRTKVFLACLACGKSYCVPPVRKNTSKYCSQKCQYERQMKHRLQYYYCNECGKKFNVPPSHAKRNAQLFCSKSCSGKYYGKRRKFSGEDNPSWKGGITPYHRAVRTSRKYKDWRTSVFKRDNYTCVLCGQKGGRLEADHIREFSRYPELIFELSNGRTLCDSCHKNTPNYGFRVVV